METETFLTANVAAFFGKATRYGDRVYGAVILNMVPLRPLDASEEAGMYPSFEQLIGTVMDRDVTEWPRMSALVGTEFEGGVVIFFSMNDGVMLALYPGAGFGDDDLGVPEGAPGDA